jgi:hypothetical protein
LEEITFETKPVIALKNIRGVVKEGIPSAPALGDARYGDDTHFREGVAVLGLLYVLGYKRRRRCGRRARDRCRRSPGAEGGGRRNGCNGIRTIGRSRFWCWLSGCRKRRGRISLGGLARRVGSVSGSVPSGSVWRIRMSSAANLVPKSICSSSGQREKPNPRSIGCPPCSRKRNSGTWSAWPSFAGSSNATTKN